MENEPVTPEITSYTTDYLHKLSDDSWSNPTQQPVMDEPIFEMRRHFYPIAGRKRSLDRIRRPRH